jgi:hypothetical protein
MERHLTVAISNDSNFNKADKERLVKQLKEAGYTNVELFDGDTQIHLETE